MAWLTETTETTEPAVDDKWLKISDPQIGKTTEVKLRILDEEPAGIWQHWEGNRPYNCPGIATCPVCKVRMDAKKSDPGGYKDRYRMNYRYFLNVLVEGDAKVKVYGFGPGVGRKLKTFLEKYGDLRDFDITIQKRKTGALPKNVEYDVFYEGKSALGADAAAIAENKNDLSEFIVPATANELKAVAMGEAPERETQPSVPEGFERFTKKGASKADMIVLKSLIEAKGYSLSEFGIVETSPPAKDVIEKLIAELRAEK